MSQHLFMPQIIATQIVCVMKVLGAKMTISSLGALASHGICCAPWVAFPIKAMPLRGIHRLLSDWSVQDVVLRSILTHMFAGDSVLYDVTTM